jgi:HSP20 family molecular chaperone IbpA
MMGGGGMGMGGGSMMNSPMMMGSTARGTMKMDLCEKDNAYHMWMDMPGKFAFLR